MCLGQMSGARYFLYNSTRIHFPQESEILFGSVLSGARGLDSTGRVLPFGSRGSLQDRTRPVVLSGLRSGWQDLACATAPPAASRCLYCLPAASQRWRIRKRVRESLVHSHLPYRPTSLTAQVPASWCAVPAGGSLCEHAPMSQYRTQYRTTACL